MGTDVIKTDFRFCGNKTAKTYNKDSTVSVVTNSRQNTSGSVILEVPIEMIIKISVFKDVTPCSLVEISQLFRGTFLSNFNITVQGLPVGFSIKFSD